MKFIKSKEIKMNNDEMNGGASDARRSFHSFVDLLKISLNNIAIIKTALSWGSMTIPVGAWVAVDPGAVTWDIGFFWGSLLLGIDINEYNSFDS